MAWTAPVAAQQTTARELARARELYRQGVQLEAANDWAGALAKFEEVAAIRMSPQVRFHVARCQHHLGKLLEALGGYRMAAHEASSDPKAAETRREAEAGVAEIEEKIPKVLLTRKAGAEMASVTLDGVALGEASIGKEVPINPGGHTVEWRAPDGRTGSVVFSVSEGGKKSVEIAFAAPPVSKAPPATEALANADGASDANTGQKPSMLPWVALGAGGVGMVAAGTFYLLRGGAKSDLESACSNGVCPASMKDTGDKGQTYTTLGNISLGVGLIGLGAGAVLLLTRPSSKAPDATVEAAKRQPTMNVMFGGSSHSAEANLVGTF